MKHKTVLSFDELRDEFSNHIKPRTTNQKLYWNLLKDDTKSIVIAHGPAGSGKTLLATQNGIDLMNLQKIEKIVITRPVVGGDEEIGFLPGTLNKKMEPWTRPPETSTSPSPDPSENLGSYVGPGLLQGNDTNHA